MHPNQALGSIAIVVDERLSRERGQILTRVINALRSHAQIDMLGSSTDEDILLQKLQAKQYSLVLAPWYRYLSWSRAEAFYGLTRTSGPTFAGYFADQVLPYEVGEQADHQRAILLDFTHLKNSEIVTLVKALARDKTRYGIRALLDDKAAIFSEHWYSGQGLGVKFDTLMSIPEIAKSDWAKRSNALRVCVSALWSLVYEEGPGKSEMAAAIGTKTPKGYFQVGVDSNNLVLRLCYPMNGWTSKDTLKTFWPDATHPTRPAQLLLKYADYLRVHNIADTPEIEIVAGFMESAPSESAHAKLHTLWIEPLSQALTQAEPVGEVPSASAPHLRGFPSSNYSVEGPKTAAAPAVDDAQLKAKDRFIAEAANKIRELKKMIEERDQHIKELRAGGVGTAPPMAPPDGEALLEAFQERYFEARLQIRQFEVQIAHAEEKGISPNSLEILRGKMAALAAREQQWIQKIAETLELFKQSRRKTGTGTGG